MYLFISEIVFNVLSMVTPFFNAIELDLCIVFPSAIGSLNGIPISIAEHNFSSISLRIISLVNSTFGNQPRVSTTGSVMELKRFLCKKSHYITNGFDS